MSAKRSVAAARHKRRLWALIVVLALVLAGAFFVKVQRKMLVREGSQFFRGILSQRMGINLQIAKITGSLLGDIRFENVRVMDRVEQPSQRVLFRAKSIRVHYRFLDFISKKFNSKIEITLESPEVFWRPYVSLRRSPFPFLGWMRGWALSGRKHLRVHTEDLAIHAEWLSVPLSGIRLDYSDNTVEAEIPLRHLPMGSYDVSTVLRLKGSFEQGLIGNPDTVSGQIVTEGSVVNWTPLAEESRLKFLLTREALEIVSSRLVGGLELTARIDFAKDYELTMRLQARDLAVSNFNAFFSAAQAGVMPKRLNLDLSLWGSPMAPHVRVRTRLEDGMLGKLAFKAFDLNADGLYPTVRLTDSRILLKDGSVMHLADKALEVRELFSERVYNTLVSEAKQDTVVWGDWQFRRPRADLDDSEFLVQRLLGDNAQVQFREFREELRTDVAQPEDQKAEIGFEYHLLAKNALKVGVRQDERYVGIEQKTRF